MALFFKTDQSRADKPLDQMKLLEWRSNAIPSTYALISIPIGLPLTIEYTRKGKTFHPNRFNYETDFLMPNGSRVANPLTATQMERVENLTLPTLSAVDYKFMDTFKVKAVLTLGASRKRETLNTDLLKHDKDKLLGENMFEMACRPFPTKSVFIEKMLAIPTFYIYDVNRPILSLMHPMFDIHRMSENIVTPCHDQDTILHARMDMVSMFGFTQWSNKYYLRKRDGREVILSGVGGRNLWAHKKYVVCMAVNEDRAATLNAERPK